MRWIAWLESVKEHFHYWNINSLCLVCHILRDQIGEHTLSLLLISTEQFAFCRYCSYIKYKTKLAFGKKQFKMTCKLTFIKQTFK